MRESVWLRLAARNALPIIRDRREKGGEKKSPLWTFESVEFEVKVRAFDGRPDESGKPRTEKPNRSEALACNSASKNTRVT
jgi:hypothetical protein